MFAQETIAAIATSSKDGSISVIRVSGDHSIKAVSEIFFNKDGINISLANCDTHTIHYGFIQDENKILDEVIVLIMKSPKSYTAEDIVEIQCHGGSFICQCILELLLRHGVRIAEPGEFTKRAFLNGRIDLSQAESVMDVIQSKSMISLDNSIAQLRGNIKGKISELRNILLSDLSFLEAALDDPEHISLDGYSEKLKKNIDSVKNEIDHLLINSQNGKIIKEGIYTAIIGKPNVGKSSFLNCILREERAIVTNIPGTTRDTLEEDVRVGSVFLHFIDTAGIHKTDDLIENIGIQKAKDSIEKANFIICILDATSELTSEDLYILEQLKENNGVILLNKNDQHAILSKENVLDVIQNKFHYNRKILNFSAKTGEGLRELEDYIYKLFLNDSISYNDEIYITNARQQCNLIDASKSIEQLLESINLGMPEDLFSIDLMNAYESLGKIIGETVEEDLINKIFQDFCMGK